jgi:hypothetical protein
MAEHQNHQIDHCPHGTDSYVPVGVDEERYSHHQIFNVESQRIFSKQGDRLNIVRLLSGSGSANASI